MPDILTPFLLVVRKYHVANGTDVPSSIPRAKDSSQMPSEAPEISEGIRNKDFTPKQKRQLVQLHCNNIGGCHPC